MEDQEKLVAMATDAMRLCLGLPTRNFTPQEILRYVSYCVAQEDQERTE